MKKISILLILISCGHVTKRNSAGSVIEQQHKKEITVKSLNARLIRNIVVDNLPKIRNCYKRQIEKTGKPFKGMATMKFTIVESGRVDSARVFSLDPNFPGPIGKCVTSVLKNIKFPRSQSGVVEVSQPFNFSPSKS